MVQDRAIFTMADQSRMCSIERRHFRY